MSSDYKRVSKSYYRYDWTPSFIEEDYDSDLGSRSTSSTLSWTDETENDAASKLKEHFDRFEAALYSESNGEDLTDIERAECNIWKERFPHLRVVGKKIEPSIYPNEEELESFPADYEEVIAIHSSEPGSKKVSIYEDLDLVDNRVVDQICERVLPSVIRKIEELTTEKLNKAETKTELEVNGTAYPKTPSPTNFRNSYLKVEDLKQFATQKPNQLLTRKFPTITLNEHMGEVKNAKGRLKRVPQSARQSKKKSIPNEYETETPFDKISITPPKSDRHGILPPIEALAITPKLPSKRATSAMLRFSKTQPRVRPFTTRNKTMYLMPVKNGFVNDVRNVQKNTINPLIEEKNNYASSLPPYSGRVYNRRSKLPPRWRY